jgi:hypothetical protein
MLIDEFMWYSKVIYGQTKSFKQIRDFTKNNKCYKVLLEDQVEVFRKMPDTKGTDESGRILAILLAVLLTGCVSVKCTLDLKTSISKNV